jgi:glycosyltransferase involved in cell wall biosynthesis
LKYSIIIPTLNEEKLLPKILKQIKSNDITSHFDAEVIISDGGSTDRTIDIAYSFSDKVVIHKETSMQNIAGGRNTGVKYAVGEYLIFLNADIIFPDIIRFFEYIENNFAGSQFMGMTCNVKIFPEEEILNDRIFHTFLNFYFYLLNVLGLGMGRGECQVVSKKVFNEFGGYNENLAAGEDFDLFRRIRKKGKILYARNFYVFESPRRYRKYGYLKVCWTWFINSYFVIFKNKSLDTEWEQIR